MTIPILLKYQMIDDGPLIAALSAFYQKVDEEIARLAGVNAGRLQCRCGCNSCCVDDIRVFGIEALNIRHRYPGLLMEEKPHPAGVCAFLDKAGGCRIYQHRPYVCRTQGLPFRWIEEDDEGERIEWRDICPLNSSEIAVEELPEEDCLTLGPFEGRLAGFQKTVFGNLERIALRELFSGRSQDKD